MFDKAGLYATSGTNGKAPRANLVDKPAPVPKRMDAIPDERCEVTGTMSTKSSRRPQRGRGGAVRANDLKSLTNLGARTRRHRYLHDARAFAVPVLITIVVQALIYLLLVTRTGRANWPAIASTCAVLAFVPAFSAIALTAFRRNEAPIMTAAAITTVFFSFAVTFLSALRLPLSYVGLVCTLPAAIALMSFANIRFQTSSFARVGMIAFKGDAAIQELLRNVDVSLITDSDIDLSAFDTILIDPEHHHTAQWSNFLARCYLARVEIMPWSRFMEIRLGRVDVGLFDISHLSYSPSQLLYAQAKRFLDVAVIVATLPVTVLFAAGTAAYIFARDGGPVLFVQHRRGLGGRPFRLYKFRTMYKGTGGELTRTGDKRIIPGCGFIRRTRLDELPQLYNILIGDMSLIGPRPVAQYVAKTSEKAEPKYALRTLVLPGISGWAQVTSGYAATTEEEINKLAYDLYYIKHLSLDLDVQILFKTAKTIVFGTGAR